MKKYKVNVNGTVYEVEIEEMTGAPAAAPVAAAPAAPAGAGERVAAPMPGNILRVNVKPGQSVKSGDSLVVLEAMKMETQVSSPIDGIVAKFQVNAQDQVQTGSLLALIKYE